MQTILGPFHPHLENALVREIVAHKKADLLCPLLILVPSASLRHRLKVLLASERRLNLLNLQILTFHQLSRHLVEEQSGFDNLELRDDDFLEEVLRQIIRTGGQVPSAFSGIEERVGGCAALWQTLRDLKDGMAEPSLAREALREGHFGRDLSDRIANLLAVFQTLLSFCENRKIQDYSDLDRFATEQVASSRYLAQFSRIFYYGFYDLTQVQVDLFHAVAQSRPTTLFFPLYRPTPSHPGWIFAERFYSRYVQGQISSVENLVVADANPENGALAYGLFDEKAEPVSPRSAKDWRCQILSAFGVHDEIAAVAKEIVRLASDEKMAFDEIGVVARSLDTYAPKIKEIFRGHRIPITGSFEEPLVEFPLAKATVLLINLRSRDYLRSHLVDLVSSPYFNTSPFCAGEVDPRPDLWDLLTRRIGIRKGIDEWRRLHKYSTRDLVLSEVWDEDHPRVLRIAAAQIRALWSLVEGIHRDLSALPDEASWSGYTGAWKKLLKKYLGITEDKGAAPGAVERLAAGEILGILERLASLDAVEPEVSLGYFTQTFQRWLERRVVSAGSQNGKGVAVLNAMAARGLSFRTLFIVGLNEGVFPRTIREDAFLRDREREIFERDLGYKVSQKLAGFDEEKLIFTLLVGAARERLYCLYQRSDESGRALAPSWYLDELRRVLGKDAAYLQEITIPRGIAEKAETAPFDRGDLLLPEELAVRLSLEGKDPTSLVENCSLCPDLYKQGRQVVERLDLSSARLDGFDGVIGLPAGYRDRISKHGLSPTALETYARCPFQYFARHLLGLERLERPEEIAGLSPADSGQLGHLILKYFYQELIDRDYFAGKASAIDLQMIIKAVARRAFADYEAENPVGYPLAWEILQEGLIELLMQVVQLDLAELSQSGFRPIALETDLTEQLPKDWPPPLKGRTIGGRMDRIDWRPERNCLRVVDYKFKSGGAPQASDKDLYRSALRGEKLQPPFYYLLGHRFAAQDKSKLAGATVEAAFYYLARHWPDGPLQVASFAPDGWAGKLGREIKKTLAYLAKGIDDGRFFIQPGDYCRHCEVSEICRKNHPPSLWRAENDPATKLHRELREKDPKDL